MEHLLLSCIESRIENNRSFYGRFQLGPFDLGQGLTVATALRRTLLSELTGLAITAVAIQGASHEYSTLCGVRESVLDILLNLKQIVFSLSESELENDSSQDLASKRRLPDSQIGFLKVCGPGIVKARDIKLPTSIQCVDPDQYIATLASNGSLEIRFIISEGKNYIVQTRSPSELASSLSQQHFSNSSLNLISSTDPRIFKSLQPSFSNNNLLQKTKNFRKEQGPIKEDLKNFKLDYFNSDSFVKTQTLKNSHRTSDQANRVEVEQNQLNTTSNVAKSIEPILGTNKFGSKAQVDGRSLRNLEESNLFSKQDSIKSRQIELLKIDKITNILLIDAVFMPVNRVNFLLENDEESIKLKEKVILEIWTNGSIHPRKAIHEAASAIIRIFLPFQEANSFQSFLLNSNLKTQQNSQDRRELYSNKKKVKFAAKKDNLAIKKNRASIDIGNLELSLRPYTCLKRANINTVSDLLQYSPDELLLLKNFGKRSLEEVETTLAQLGLKLGTHTSTEVLSKNAIR